MDNYNPMNMQMDFADRMERLYPETAAMIAPYARELVDGIHEDALEAVSSVEIGRMADEAMRRSGMAANMPAGHNVNTLSDLGRALVVRELIDRHRRGRGRFDGRFPFFPFFFFPFDGRDFGRFPHGFDRGFGGRRI